jgi:hypothetical protein
MARKVVLETGYTFNPSTRTVIIPKVVPRERLILITNVTSNQIIYNFTDGNLGATSYTVDGSNYQQGVIVDPQTFAVTSATSTTTIVLNYNTTSMSSGDKLQIIMDEYEEKFMPSETLMDPVSKLRVSEPEALIDTDFEYSVQPTKWEGLSLSQNYPSFYAKGSGATAFDVTVLSGGNQTPRSTITVTTSVAHNLVVGDVVVVQDTTNQLADGTFLVDTVPSATQFTYFAKGQVNGSILDTGYTTIYGGGIYPGARIPIANSASGITTSGTSAPFTVTVTTANAHGLYPGTQIALNNVSASTGTAPNGNWVITNVSTPTTFTFQVPSASSGLSAGSNFQSANLYTRPEGYQQHRATDGGVLITTGGNYTGAQQIRQTRRYFRYQSGKAIQYSTGAKFTPTLDVDNITCSATTVTVTTLQDHGLQVGVTIKVEGVVSSAGSVDSARYNRTTTVATVTGTKSFTYAASSTPTDLAPGGTNAYVTAIAWKGAVTRLGLYDNQNGFYFEYNGETLFACRRDSVKELFGRIAVTQNSGAITGTSTRFREQLVVGDQIVIKGQTYEVAQILSDTSLRINPAYIGPTRTGVRYLKTQFYKVPQSQWNLDKMNGTGPSGYTIDISKMQMAYIDYTWYGAGFARFGFRAVNGDIVYCHKMPGNNVNFAAYQRSGNLPGRFEAANFGPYTRLVSGTTTRGAAFTSALTTMYVENAVGWPSTGHVMVSDGTNNELIRYTGIGAYDTNCRAYPLTGLTRRTTYSIAGINALGTFNASAYTFSGTSSSVTFTPDAGVGGAGTAQVSVQYIYNDCAPIISHWGVSVIMDGGYDNDRSIFFTAGMNRYLSITAGATRPLIAIRIAPSVDSGIGRNFGIREIINRMQLTLRALGVYSQGQFLIEGILNPQTMVGTGLTFPTNWQTVPVGAGSLAQVVYWDGTQLYNAAAASATGTFTGGDRVFAAYAENSGGTNFSATRIDLTEARDLGTSILSGDGLAGNVNPSFPVGPDVLLIVARNISASTTSNIACRLSWTEAQA